MYYLSKKWCSYPVEHQEAYTYMGDYQLVFDDGSIIATLDDHQLFKLQVKCDVGTFKSDIDRGNFILLSESQVKCLTYLLRNRQELLKFKEILSDDVYEHNESDNDTEVRTIYDLIITYVEMIEYIFAAECEAIWELSANPGIPETNFFSSKREG